MGTVGSSKEQLLRAEISIRDATIFVTLALETGPWPFRIDNLTDSDVVIYQAVL